MKRLPFTLILLFMVVVTGMTQNIGINDNNTVPKASAMLDVYSTNKGMLIPRIALTATTAAAPVTSPETSLLVYNTNTIGDVTPGYYYWNSTKWVRLYTSSDPGIMTTPVLKSADATLLKTENMVFASGNITLTLPAVTSADDGLEISVKNTGTYTDLVTVVPQSGKTIDSKSNSLFTRWRGRTFVAQGSNWYVKDKEIQNDNYLDVSSYGSFTTIAEVVAFLNGHMSGPTVVQLGGATYNITATQSINLPYPVTFIGSSYGETNITGSSGVSGTPLFTCASECYFKMLIFNAYANAAGNDAIRFTGAAVYHEVKDCVFTGFNKGIVTTNNTDLWIFENDFENCAGAGVEIAAGAASGGRLRISETDFMQCTKGVNLLSGVGETISIQNNTFYNTTSGSDIGIFYNPATFTSYATMIISHNAWNNQGTFVSGFDFTRTDGRDANVHMLNNSGMESEAPHFKVTLLNNPTGTTASGTIWVKANWNTSSTYLTTYTCKWNLATANRCIYQPLNKSDVIMWISGNVASSGNSRTLNVGICKNGVTTTRYGETTLRTGSTGTIPVQFSTIVYIPNVGPGDYFELWYSNASNNNNETITFSDLGWWAESK